MSQVLHEKASNRSIRLAHCHLAPEPVGSGAGFDDKGGYGAAQCWSGRFNIRCSASGSNAALIRRLPDCRRSQTSMPIENSVTMIDCRHRHTPAPPRRRSALAPTMRDTAANSVPIASYRRAPKGADGVWEGAELLIVCLYRLTRPRRQLDGDRMKKVCPHKNVTGVRLDRPKRSIMMTVATNPLCWIYGN